MVRGYTHICHATFAVLAKSSLAAPSLSLRMRQLVALLLLLCASAPAIAEDAPQPIRIMTEVLGDSPSGVVARVTFRLAIPAEVPEGAPLVVQGSVLRAGEVVRNFRYVVPTSERTRLAAAMLLPEGDSTIEARLLIDVAESTPVIVAKTSTSVALKKTGSAYVASDADGATGIVAEGASPEAAGAVKIVNPRRDVAPNLFIVDVEVKAPVKRVEFWVEGKKIAARNAPPYRAELDLGQIPKRVEVKAIGYDDAGRYVDADAFVVNERDTPLEVKITRVEGKDGISHVKLSVQNPQGRAIKSAVLYAGQKKIREWAEAPYAIDIPAAQLAGVEFIRASVTDETNYEASDLLFLNGQRFTEEIEVNLVELPVSVTDAAGVPIGSLKEADFTVLEEGKPQKLTTFNFASNLPISVGVLVDHSGSMKPRMKQAKDAAIEFFKDIIKGQDRAFAGGFSFDAAAIAPFVANVEQLQQQVEAIPDAEGGTSLYDAIVSGLYRFRNVQGRKALVVVTDGEDTTSRVSYDEMLTYARAARVPLYFIGIGMGFSDLAGTSKMKSLAAETGGVAYFIRNAEQLSATYKQLESDLRSQYLLAYNTESSKTDRKYRTVEVKVSRADAKVRTIRGFIP